MNRLSNSGQEFETICSVDDGDVLRVNDMYLEICKKSHGLIRLSNSVHHKTTSLSLSMIEMFYVQMIYI